MSPRTIQKGPGTGGKVKTLAVCAMAALASLSLAVPASAMPVGDGVRAGRNISVFGNLDFVAAFGHPVGQKLTVDVYRGGTRIATAFGPAVSTPEGGGLEVNHGVEGNVAQGDCWENFTPDVRPGDRVVVTDSSGATDQVLVDDITMGAPREDLATEDDTDVIVEGTASYADGRPMDVADLNSGELRLGSDFRATPNSVTRIEGTENGWRATYKAPYNDFRNGGLDQEEQKQAILNGDHAMGYGHVAPLPAETQMVEGLGAGGPAPGCEADAPDAPPSAMGVVSPELVSQANVNGSVSVSGVIQDGVDVALQLNGADLPPELPTARVDRTNGTWSAEFPAALLRQGGNEVKATYTGPNAPAQPQTANVERDTTAPAAATPNPKPGPYNTDQSVDLGLSEAGARIRYTTDGSDPSATTGTLYGGNKIPATAEDGTVAVTTIKTVTIDAAGNAGPVTPLEYRIDKVDPKAPVSNIGAGPFDAPQTLTLQKDAADTDVKEIRYTVGQGSNVPANPTANSGTVYTGPISVAGTQTVKAVAVDEAGNVSEVLTQKVTIRETTTTSLGVFPKKPKLGKSLTIQGSVSPSQANGAVTVTINRPGGLRTITNSETLDDLSRFGVAYKPKATGLYKVTVDFAGGDDAKPSTSPIRSFRVVR